MTAEKQVRDHHAFNVSTKRTMQNQERDRYIDMITEMNKQALVYDRDQCGIFNEEHLEQDISTSFIKRSSE